MSTITFDADPASSFRSRLYWRIDRSGHMLVQHVLDSHKRRPVVAHELADHPREGGCDRAAMPATWQAVGARDERGCDRAAAQRLVPPDELADWLEEVAFTDDGGIRTRQASVPTISPRPGPPPAASPKRQSTI